MEQMIPRPYQEEGIDFLANNVYASLWDEPGLGKTFQTLMAAKKINAVQILVVCPASVRLVWAEECKKVGLPYNIITDGVSVKPNVVNIVSFDGAADGYYDDIMDAETILLKLSEDCDEILDYKWEVLVIDEEHFLKGFNSRTVTEELKSGKEIKVKVPTKRTEAIFGRHCDLKNCIGQVVLRIWGLTGTPMPNDPSELYAVIRAKFPDVLIKPNGIMMSYNEFISKYCKTRGYGWDLKIVGGKNLQELRKKLEGRVLRRKKSEVAKDLPEIQYSILPVEGDLSDIPEEELECVKECLAAKDPMLELKENVEYISSLRRFTGMAKVKAVKKWVEEANHEKIVIFAHHKVVIDELCSMANTVRIDGSCTQKQREKAVEEFQNGKAQRLVGQIQSAGTGLTLTAANTLLFIEYSWTPAENRQAADRIHRIGQQNNCLVYFATVPNSIDEHIMKVVKRKTETYKELGL
jgi:SNF2 family DNA or RNA helicase